MKITKQQLKQLIQEELNGIEPGEDEPASWPRPKKVSKLKTPKPPPTMDQLTGNRSADQMKQELVLKEIRILGVHLKILEQKIDRLLGGK